jgi:hypothetical protein
MTLRILTFALLALGLVCPYFAYDKYVDGTALLDKAKRLERQNLSLLAEEKQLAALGEKKILPKSEALSDLILNLRAEVDLLGGSVRLDIPESGQIRWVDVKHGISSLSFAVTVSAVGNAALATFPMVGELVEARAIRIRKAAIKPQSDTYSMGLEIELFGR